MHIWMLVIGENIVEETVIDDASVLVTMLTAEEQLFLCRAVHSDTIYIWGDSYMCMRSSVRLQRHHIYAG